MATTITYNNLVSESWQNVYDLIKSSVTDPLGQSNRKWVYTRDPNLKSLSGQQLPYIVVNPSMISFDDKQTVDLKVKTVNWSVELEIVSTDGVAGDALKGKGQTQNDSITDSLLSVFNSVTNRNTLAANGLKFSIPEVTAAGTIIINQQVVYRRSIFLSFKNKMSVSA